MTMGLSELQHEIEQFLYSEVRLLSEGRYHEWTALFSDDVRYSMPTRENIARPRDGADESALQIFDDDKAFLQARAERLDSDLAHAERPPSRTRYFVSNVQVTANGDGDFDVRCNLMVFQSRMERTEVLFVGRREDCLRRNDRSWNIVRRKIVPDHAVMPRSLSIMF